MILVLKACALLAMELWKYIGTLGFLYSVCSLHESSRVLDLVSDGM
jgi:hypothetical protein